MLGYIGHCLLRLAVAVVGIVTVAFFLTRAIPGDPAEYMLGDFATQQLDVAIRWGRYAELFAYDADTEELYLEH